MEDVVAVGYLYQFTMIQRAQTDDTIGVRNDIVGGGLATQLLIHNFAGKDGRKVPFYLLFRQVYIHLSNPLYAHWAYAQLSLLSDYVDDANDERDEYGSPQHYHNYEKGADLTYLTLFLLSY